MPASPSSPGSNSSEPAPAANPFEGLTPEAPPPPKKADSTVIQVYRGAKVDPARVDLRALLSQPVEIPVRAGIRGKRP